MPYANLENLLTDYLSEVKKDIEKDAIERMLAGVSSFVDKYCNRPSGYFDPAIETPSMKRVRGEGYHFLRLPKHVFGSITEINSQSFADLSSQIYESDKNGWLYYETSEFGNDCKSFEYGKVYKVTARWGFEATPADIQQAVCQIVQRWFRTANGIIGDQMPNGFVLEREMPKSAKAVLDTYKKREFEI